MDTAIFEAPGDYKSDGMSSESSEAITFANLKNFFMKIRSENLKSHFLYFFQSSFHPHCFFCVLLVRLQWN